MPPELMTLDNIVRVICATFVEVVQRLGCAVGQHVWTTDEDPKCHQCGLYLEDLLYP